MDLKPFLSESWHSFSSNPMRSALSVIGVVFGIASVIAMLNIGVGAEKQMNAMLSAMGEQNIHIIGKDLNIKQWSTLISKTNGLSYRDVEMMEEFYPQSIVSPILNIKLDGTIPKTNGFIPTLSAISLNFSQVSKLNFAAGRIFSPYEAKMGVPVAILGGEMARKWFGDTPSNALNKEIRLNGGWFKVIGVLRSYQEVTTPKTSTTAAAGDSSGSGDSNILSFDNNIITSFNALEARVYPILNVADYSRVIVKLPLQIDPLLAQKTISLAESNLHHGAQVVDVIAATQIIEQKKKTTNLFSYFLLSIASISLIVGGIGIANVMLASMQERIYEVGLRRAIGARKKDILIQFLLECVVICLFGGIIGTILGIVGAFIVVKITGWPVAFPWWSIISAVGISVLVGILAGIYPAMKASSIHPVNALQGQK